MSDNVTVDNGGLTDYTVASEELSGGAQLQSVELHTESGGTKTKAGTATNALRVDPTGTTAQPVTDNGSTLSVDDGGGALTVDGTVTVQDGGSTISVDDGGSSLTVDGSVSLAAALPAGTNNIGDVDVLTLPALPAGTNNIGDVDVLTLPAIPAGNNNIGDVDVASIAAGDNNIGNVDIVTVPAPLSTTGGGTEATAHRVTIANDSTGVLSVDDNGSSLTVDNGGTFVTQENGAALTALQLIDDTIFADDAAFTPGTSKVSALGLIADETSTDSVDEGDVGAPRMTLNRRQIVVPQGHSLGGLSIFRSLDLDETEEDVKTAAGTLYGWYIANLATSTRFVKFYNATAANTTVGSTTPVMTLPIPGNSTDDVGANALGGVGIAFDTAISVAATTGVADADTGAPGANEVVVNLFYA